MARAFQGFYGKQRMLPRNVMLFRSNQFNKGIKGIDRFFSLSNLSLFLNKRPRGQYAASLIFTAVKVKLFFFYPMRRVHARSAHAEFVYLDPCPRS